MMKLLYRGEDVYRGCDGSLILAVEPNTVIEVSKEKAEQLLQDFTTMWVLKEDAEVEDDATTDVDNVPGDVDNVPGDVDDDKEEVVDRKGRGRLRTIK